MAMSRLFPARTASAACLLLAVSVFAAPLRAQELTPPGPAAAGEAPPVKPKPKPKPRPKPKPAPAAETGPETEPAKADNPPNGGAKGAEPRASESTVPALDKPGPAPNPVDAGLPAPTGFAGPGVLCEPGQSVLYDGPQDFSMWVTRSGIVRIDNPLRPLTPEVTRVLQLVIAGKIATAYGPDYTALRRGGAPALVEGALGGPIRWEAKLGNLPDSLDIISDSGDPLAQMRFKECGTAPAAKALPVAKALPASSAKGRKRAAPPPDPANPDAAARYDPPQATRPLPRRLPQGAIPE